MAARMLRNELLRLGRNRTQVAGIEKGGNRIDRDDHRRGAIPLRRVFGQGQNELISVTRDDLVPRIAKEHADAGVKTEDSAVGKRGNDTRVNARIERKAMAQHRGMGMMDRGEGEQIGAIDGITF